MDEMNYINKILTNLNKAKSNIAELLSKRISFENLIIDQILKNVTNEDISNVLSI